MSTVYAKLGLVPLCCLVASCASSTSWQVRESGPFTQADAAADAFVAAWNAGDRALVLGTFEPRRRETIAAALAPELAEIASVEVSARCNPRGTFWKTMQVGFASGSAEVMWLRRVGDRWWMYAL